MYLLCNKELHVSGLADHNEAVWSTQTGTCSILLLKNYSRDDGILLNTGNHYNIWISLYKSRDTVLFRMFSV